MDIQELVARARLLFRGSSKRSDAFKLINGKRSGKDLSKIAKRSFSSILQDLQKMKDMELIQPRRDDEGLIMKKDGSIIYEKSPLLKHLSESYFTEPTKLPVKKNTSRKVSIRSNNSIKIPNENEILDICKSGEDQNYEFKEAGVEMHKLSKEICAFANTKAGGIIFYGIQDDGSIAGSNMPRQKFDQSIQNSNYHTISPSLNVKVTEKDVVGHKIILIIIPSWNRKDVYQHEGRIYLRKGTNVFVAKPEEIRQLHNGKPVV